MVVLPSCEREVGDKAATSVLHVDTNSGGSLRTGRYRHLEIAVGDTGSLSDLPMYSGRDINLIVLRVRPVLACHIEHKIANLSIEVALVDC
jgi:hypothetical protein